MSVSTSIALLSRVKFSFTVRVLALCSVLRMSSSLSTPGTRTILITGATDGIGKHTSQRLAAEGNNHLLVHGKRPVGDEVTSDLMKRGALSAHYFQADLSDLEQVEQFAQEVIKSDIIQQSKSSLDVLINNAGIFDPPHPAKSVQGYDKTWAVNVMAPFVLTRRLLPLLAASNDACPRVITTSSISQSYTLPSSMDELFGIGSFAQKSKSVHTAYSHSKLGDYMFTVQLANLLKQSNNPQLQCIKCLTMDPGTVNTKMLLAGWGPCGINVKNADNTFRLATDYGSQQESGTYHFGGGGSRDAKDVTKLEMLFEKLEECTGCTYKDINENL